MYSLSGKVALVTGGSRGIGRATAEVLAEQGGHVVVTYAGKAEAASAAVAGIERALGKAEAVRLDTADAEACEKTIAEVSKRLGRLDALVCNAGISIDSLVLRLKDEDFERVLSVNLKGAVACARAGIKVMMRAKTGRIVFVSSVVGEMGNTGRMAYA